MEMWLDLNGHEKRIGFDTRTTGPAEMTHFWFLFLAMIDKITDTS